ncbi:MAG: MBL fold metallo-hydrolase [Bacteroidales bacterium]
MKLKKFIFNELKVNSYLLWDEAGNCVLIDPGCHNAEEQKELSGFINSRGLIPRGLLHTHGHIDHMAGSGYIRKTYEVSSWIHEEEEMDPDTIASTARIYGMNLEKKDVMAHKVFRGQQRFTFDGVCLEVIHTPGHTKGSVCFYEPTHHWLFTGDTLTKGSLCFSDEGYGRLLNCLNREIITLPEDTQFFFGHGPDSSMKEEMASNPFFRRMKNKQGTQQS